MTNRTIHPAPPLQGEASALCPTCGQDYPSTIRVGDEDRLCQDGWHQARPAGCGVHSRDVRCDRCGSAGDTYVLCSGCGAPVSAPYPVQAVLRECASRCRYDGDLFHDQGNIERRDASWRAAEMAEAALSSLVPSAQLGCGDPGCKDPNCEYGK